MQDEWLVGSDFRVQLFDGIADDLMSFMGMDECKYIYMWTKSCQLQTIETGGTLAFKPSALRISGVRIRSSHVMREEELVVEQRIRKVNLVRRNTYHRAC